jgi:integrase
MVLLSDGINPKFVQELLGHEDIKLTLGTYSHFLPSMGNRTAARYGERSGINGLRYGCVKLAPA